MTSTFSFYCDEAMSYSGRAHSVNSRVQVHERNRTWVVHSRSIKRKATENRVRIGIHCPYNGIPRTSPYRWSLESTVDFGFRVIPFQSDRGVRDGCIGVVERAPPHRFMPRSISSISSSASSGCLKLKENIRHCTDDIYHVIPVMLLPQFVTSQNTKIMFICLLLKRLVCYDDVILKNVRGEMSGQRSQTVKFGVMHTVAYKGDVVLLSVSIDTARLIQCRDAEMAHVNLPPHCIYIWEGRVDGSVHYAFRGSGKCPLGTKQSDRKCSKCIAKTVKMSKCVAKTSCGITAQSRFGVYKSSSADCLSDPRI
ncbi:hypothetical protein HUJ04_012489 [Dendroctonus ponderosae]|nr:hypothetical protein HUJ04_012489 [Dendroctonus ponderosae]KAH1029713.1 hypothetical protein HUJ05_002894 [Dendroctonus ponderosae]